MARLPKRKPTPEPTVDPLAWVTAGRWAGDRRFNLQAHECDRAAWLEARWATARAPGLKHVLWPGRVLAAVPLPAPPEPVTGLAAELLCPGCPQAGACAGEALARSCRTCRHVIAWGSWRCMVDGMELTPEQQRAGCNLWAPVEEVNQ